MDAPLLTDIPAALALADTAIARLTADPVELFALTIARARAERGLAADPGAILTVWAARRTSAYGVTRYPWPISPREAVAITGASRPWLPWRPRDAAALRAGESVRDFEARFLGPLVLASAVDELVHLRDAGGPAGEAARSLLAEHRAKLRRDAAGPLAERHAWADTWALWCTVRHPKALELFGAYALAIATAYAERAREDGGVVVGTRYPFHGEPLASATAQLAAGLVALGVELDVEGALAGRVQATARADGGWGDADGPSDVLTTLVAADLLAGLDPAFDPRPAAAFLARSQGRSGLWAAYGPDAPWLTERVAAFLAAADRPFAVRFRPPAAALADLDRRTGLPRYDHYAGLADLAAAVPGLAAAPWEVAFLDLIGFRAFNNQRGMAEGDRALAVFAGALRDVPGVSAIRDGGDEFLAVAAPAGRGPGLADRMRAFLLAWRGGFDAVFPGAPPVAPRVLVGRAPGRDLVALRDGLGRAIGKLKHVRDQPIAGFVVDLGDLGGPGPAAPLPALPRHA